MCLRHWGGEIFGTIFLGVESSAPSHGVYKVLSGLDMADGCLACEEDGSEELDLKGTWTSGPPGPEDHLDQRTTWTRRPPGPEDHLDWQSRP